MSTQFSPYGRRSLRTRITLGMLLALVLTLWLTTLLISHSLRQQMEDTISAQQFSTVSLTAREVDRSVSERVQALQSLTRQFKGKPVSTAAIQPELLRRPILLMMFNWGIVVLDKNGQVQASIPESLGRDGHSYADSAFFRLTMQHGGRYITEPMQGHYTGKPVISMLEPLLDANGKLEGLIMGVTNLAQPNFLDDISAARYGATGSFFITAPQSRRYIMSSDKQRLLKAGPPPGINPLYDRYIAGYEGSGVAMSSRGVLELSSSVHIKSTGWLMQSVLPAEEAFAPIRTLQRQLFGLALLLTLLAGGLSWWWLRRQLLPLSEATQLLTRMGDGELPKQPLPVSRADEVGLLATSFNTLLERIQREEEKAAEHAANQLLRKIVSQIPGVVFQYRMFSDGHGCFPFASEAFYDIYGIRPEAVSQSADAIRNLLHPVDRDSFFEALHHSAQTLTQWRTEYRICLPDGQIKWLLVDAMPEQDGSEVLWYGFIADISRHKRMEAELRIAATTFLTQEGIMVTDPDGHILRVNPSFSQITGYDSADVVGKTPAVLSSHRHPAAFYQQLWQSLLENGAWQGEIWNTRKTGEVFPEWLTITAVKDNAGHTSHYVAIFQDITERKAAADEIQTLAFYDALTHLPNRRLLQDRLQHARDAARRQKEYGALLFLDLDNFKSLNDTMGHDIGDVLLQEVASRLLRCLRTGDTVARLGGDEFIVMLENLGPKRDLAMHEAETVGRKILATLHQPYQLRGYDYRGSSSLGIALFADENGSSEDILKQADLAMYQAKSAGRNTLRFFDPVMQAEINTRTQLEAELHHALEHGELSLYYQPQIRHGKPCQSVEALLRWHSPQQGLRLPGSFIPLAEQSNLILAIDHWVLQQACTQLAAWASHADTAGLSIAVNVSARQFHQSDFVSRLRRLLQDSGANPALLKLEITESLLLMKLDDAGSKMNSLRQLGITFALDDFGTGYSSLSYLKQLPLDQVKIDHSFVRDVLDNPNDAAICKAVIALGHSLGLTVIAEGVETAAQYDFLVAQGCEVIQGYLFSQALPPEQLQHWLAHSLPDRHGHNTQQPTPAVTVGS
ncbi:bifunctional diguanylate cyclase/phosphodiesterase [Aquitalea aquatica]|uniref:EAL domain-containing protein n=1 Tax=Aquitalea aquatica TaxID=3044273 RepID=A0A838YB07_9NEIS|nr:EAL domain-containing protein [Aquitalea magnusonii]MBA4707851.1 EAL domain-containing protein [Aquitalea magnusonii]